MSREPRHQKSHNHGKASSESSFYGRRPLVRWLALDVAGTNIQGERPIRAGCHNTIGVAMSTTTAYAMPSGSTSSGPVDWEKRRDEPRVGFVHAMRGCQTHAFPRDELFAVSGSFFGQVRFLRYVFLPPLPFVFHPPPSTDVFLPSLPTNPLTQHK